MEEKIKMHDEAIKKIRKLDKTSIKTILFLFITIIFFIFSIKISFLVLKISFLLLVIFFLTKFLKNLSYYIKDLIFYFIEKNKKEKNVELENSLIEKIDFCKCAIANNKTYFEAKKAYTEAQNLLEEHYYKIPMATVFAAEDELKKLKNILDKCN